MADIVSVISQFVSLKRKGREYIGVCPFHEDTDPSLKVNPEKGIFKCFVCGKGGHVNSFLYEYNKLYHTNHKLDIKSEHIKPKSDFKDKLDDWKIITPVPNWVEQPSFRHFNYGVPNSVWRYTDIKGTTMYYVCRFNRPDGKKEIMPYTYCAKDNVGKWMWRGMEKNRPLYNLKIIANSDKPIVIAEGEKVCDAGMLSSEIFNFTTFQGGSNAYQLTDYTPLKGKTVIIFRDNDEAGTKCMDGVRSLLKPLCKSIYEVGDLSDMPKKWDLADRKWKKDELDNFIKSRILR